MIVIKRPSYAKDYPSHGILLHFSIIHPLTVVDSEVSLGERLKKSKKLSIEIAVFIR